MNKYKLINKENHVVITNTEKKKAYKLDKNKGIYPVGKVILNTLLIVTMFLIMCAWLKHDSEEVAKCFEENSHLTLREQKGVCTWD